MIWEENIRFGVTVFGTAIYFSLVLVALMFNADHRAAQRWGESMYRESYSDALEVLTKAIYANTQGEDAEAKRYFGVMLRNRYYLGLWGSTYTSIYDKSSDITKLIVGPIDPVNNKEWQLSRRAAEDVYYNLFENQYGRITHFSKEGKTHAPNKDFQFRVRIGGLYFFHNPTYENENLFSTKK